MCSDLDEKYRTAALQELLRKATFLDLRYRGNISDAVFVDDTKDQLLKEMMEMREEGGNSDGGGDCDRAVAEEDSGSAPPTSKKKNLSNLLQNRKAQIATRLYHKKCGLILNCLDICRKRHRVLWQILRCGGVTAKQGFL